jgi:hypothetical protein
MTNGGDNSRTRRTRDDPRSELLSSAYRDAVENTAAEPRRSVDDAVRAAAHRAVETRPRSIKAAGLQEVFRRWRTPLALAATLLLAVGIALRVYKTGEMEMVLPRAPAKGQSYQQHTSAKKEAEKPQPKIAEKRAANEADRVPSPSDAARSSEERAALDEDIARKAGISRNKDTPSPAPAEHELRAESGTAQVPQSQTTERQEAQPTAKPFPGASDAVQAPPPARKLAAAPRAQVPAQTTAAPALSQSRSSLRGRPERTDEEKVAAAPPTEVQLLAKRLDGRPPEAWIEEIRNLKRAGRSAEATELLAALRKKFPNFALPDDLK